MSSDYTTELIVQTDEFVLEAEINIKPTVDQEKAYAEQLQEHLNSCLVNFVVEPDTEST